MTAIGLGGGSSPAAPTKTGNPSISGSPIVGQVLTATHGTYTGTLTGYNQQWYSGASPIALATALTYTVQSSDLGNNITYQESAYNGSTSNASATGTSNALGPVTSGGASPQLTGMNLTGTAYYNLDKPEAEYWNTGQYEYQDSSSNWHPLADAPNGSATTGDLNTHNGWPTTAPSLGPDGVHYTFRKVIGMPPQTAPVTLNVTWSGNAYNISVGNGGGSWTSTGANSGTFLFNQDMSHDRTSMQGASFLWSILPGDSTPAKNFSIKLSGAGLLEPIFVSNSSAFGLKLLRFMKCTNAEGNYNIWPGAGFSTPYPPAQVTAATRNTVTSGNWGNPGGNPLSGNDGMPIERQLAIAAGIGADVWTSINYNGSTDYYQAIANAIVANIGPTQKVYMEVSNEVWNGGYIVWDQANREGLSKSIGTTITQMSLASNVVTCTCAGAHNLVAGDIFTSTLPQPYEFNALGAAATIIDGTHFSYPVASTRASLTSATPSTTGGTLAAGTYYYKIAAIVGGVETLASNEVSATTTGSTSSVVLAWASYPGAGSYKIYRGTAAGVENVYYAPAGTSLTFTDTGAAPTAGTPLTSTTITSNFGYYGKGMRWPASFSHPSSRTAGGVAGSGPSAILRYAERSAEIFTIMEPIFQTAGIMGRIQRCFMLQQGSTANYIPAYMDYVMPDTSTVASHIDIVGCSSYFDPHNHGYPDTYTPVGNLSDVGPCITASYLGADDTIQNCLNIQAEAALYGKGFGAYEGYYGLTISNGGSPTANQIAFVDAVIADSRFTNVGMYFLQQWQMKIGNCPNMLFCDAQPAANGAQWGILQYMSQSIASQPKANAIAQYAAGKVSITPSGLIYGTQTAPLGSPNGTLLGAAPARGAPGSTYSIVSNINTDAIGVNASTGQLMVNNSAHLPGTTGSYNVTVRESNANAINSPQYVDTVVAVVFSPALVNTHAYRYYAVQIDHCATPGVGCKIAELELSIAVGGLDVTTPSTTISAWPGSASGHPVTNVIDNASGDYWFSLNSASGGQSQSYPAVITIDLGAGNGQKVNELRITPVDTAGSAPSALQLLGSDDGTTWTKLLVLDGITWPTTAQQSFDITSLPVAPVSVFDNFDENAISAKWTTGSFYKGTAPSGQTVQVSNGELEILPSGTTGYDGLISVNAASFIGGYILFQRVAANQGNSIFNVHARVGPDTNNGYGWCVEGGNIFLEGFSAGTRTRISSLADPDYSKDEPTTYGWFRLRHGGAGDDTMYIEGAAPSATVPTTWTVLLSAPRSNTYWNSVTTPNLKVALGAGQWTNSSGIPNARFDNFDTNLVL